MFADDFLAGRYDGNAAPSPGIMRRHWERRCFHKMAEEMRKVCSKLYSFSIVYRTEHLLFIVVHLLAQESFKCPWHFVIVFRSLLQIDGGLFIMTNRWASI